MKRVLCRFGLHRWRWAVSYHVRGWDWGEQRCTRCPAHREVVNGEVRS